MASSLNGGSSQATRARTHGWPFFEGTPFVVWLYGELNMYTKQRDSQMQTQWLFHFLLVLDLRPAQERLIEKTRPSSRQSGSRPTKTTFLSGWNPLNYGLVSWGVPQFWVGKVFPPSLSLCRTLGKPSTRGTLFFNHRRRTHFETCGSHHVPLELPPTDGATQNLPFPDDHSTGKFFQSMGNTSPKWVTGSSRFERLE